MSVPQRPARRPRIEDRIAVWLTAYRAVMDEIDAEIKERGTYDQHIEASIAAAQVAAELVKGVESGDDAGTR